MNSRLPDVIISTPEGIWSLLKQGKSYYGEQWNREGFMAGIKYIIMDEVDLLLSGSYEYASKQVLELARREERKRNFREIITQLKITPQQFMSLESRYRIAAYYGGIPAMIKAGYKPSAEIQFDSQEVERAPSSAQWEWWFQELPFSCKEMRQRRYIFVGATIPGGGKISTARQLSNYFQQAAWVLGPYLHSNISSIQHSWIQVDDKAYISVLRRMVLNDDNIKVGLGKILVFVNRVEQVQVIVDALQNRIVPILQYHKKLPPAENIANLRTFRSEDGVVLVATDWAARGLDIPNVSHVIQAQFAESAVIFLHRTGRTGRAGMPGRVTSLYTEKDSDLVNAIRQLMQKGGSIEGVFSRNRSFRKKIRKYGEFVPRQAIQQKKIRNVDFSVEQDRKLQKAIDRK
eukprot:TRINITY_DN6035_c0_g1_i1.p1 TRINITY_DN6035_c0_g1~~TRINITY_DN6035_c0_g1_i1.p1  ORF type:complete len:403 (+),score=27.86 TRINITY_DN6035_c0_g1_i1:491-1699(+)